MPETAILTPVRAIIYSKHYSKKEFQYWVKLRPDLFAVHKPARRRIMVGGNLQSRQGVSFAAPRLSLHTPTCRIDKTPQTPQRRRSSLGRITVCEHNCQAREEELNNVLFNFEPNSYDSRIGLRAAQKIRAGIKHSSHRCSFGNDCRGTVTLAWWSSGSSRARDSTFHVVSEYDYDAEICLGNSPSSPGSTTTMSSSPTGSTDSAYSAFLSRQNTAERAERQRVDEENRRKWQEEFDRRAREDRDRQRAQRAGSGGNPRHGSGFTGSGSGSGSGGQRP